jgi:hypothetical protein
MLGYQSFFEKIMSDVRERRVPACPLNNIPGRQRQYLYFCTSKASKCRMYASGVCLLAPSTTYQEGSVSICTFILVKQVNVGCTVRERRVPAFPLFIFV